MQQIVIVTRLLPGDRAEVACRRQSACSGDCHQCAGCGAAQEVVTVTAENHLGAVPGDKVLVESSTKTVLAVAAVACLVPMLLFFLGYGLGAACQTAPGILGGCGFLLGLLAALWYDRRLAKKKSVQYKIIGYADR